MEGNIPPEELCQTWPKLRIPVLVMLRGQPSFALPWPIVELTHSYLFIRLFTPASCHSKYTVLSGGAMLQWFESGYEAAYVDQLLETGLHRYSVTLEHGWGWIGIASEKPDPHTGSNVEGCPWFYGIHAARGEASPTTLPEFKDWKTIGLSPPIVVTVEYQPGSIPWLRFLCRGLGENQDELRAEFPNPPQSGYLCIGCGVDSSGSRRRDVGGSAFVQMLPANRTVEKSPSIA
eukprot:TRINITY_DN15914_c0_g1_i1.p1 TRINITY_DN15914_c0_g1~~TRINITY_DN15914_c0_g1_i1.p1  ORF type:complete len:233 (+),score=11.92 TRINITY_DN15914_c0_g1_i1:19-717(+)